MYHVLMQTPPNGITCDCQETLEQNNLNFISALLIQVAVMDSYGLLNHPGIEHIKLAIIQ